jgi:hypothetical protein
MPATVRGVKRGGRTWLEKRRNSRYFVIMGVVESGACLNCGAAMAGPFCARCGQKAPMIELTLGELLRDTTHELTNLEGKVPATLKALLVAPGRLTQDFLAGRRARWLTPLRLYLICSVAYFLSGPLVESLTNRSARQMARVVITNPDGSKVLTEEGKQMVAEGLPARIFGYDRLARAATNGAQLNRAVETAFPKAMFVLLPLFALLTRTAWHRRVRRYPAHLYLALHLHAALFAVLTIVNVVLIPSDAPIVAGTVGFAAAAYLVWYGLAALHRVFGESWMRTAVKATLVMAAYFACVFVTSLLILGYAVATL